MTLYAGALRTTSEHQAIQAYADHHVRTAMAFLDWHLEVVIEQAMDEYTQDYYAIATC